MPTDGQADMFLLPARMCCCFLCFFLVCVWGCLKNLFFLYCCCCLLVCSFVLLLIARLFWALGGNNKKIKNIKYERNANGRARKRVLDCLLICLLFFVACSFFLSFSFDRLLLLFFYVFVACPYVMACFCVAGSLVFFIILWRARMMFGFFENRKDQKTP